MMPIELHQLVSPEGRLIIGTYEMLAANAAAAAAFSVDADGTVDIQYAGSTDVDWDSQETALDGNGRSLVVDSDYEIWPIDKCLSYRQYLTLNEWQP